METPRFPRPTAGVWPQTAPHEAAAFLDEVATWCIAMGDWIEATADIGDAMKDLLRRLLDGITREFPPELALYSLATFPRAALAELSPAGAVAVLTWRYGIVSFLSDVWDVIGDPVFDIAECQVVQRAFGPADDGLCPHCLLEVREEERGGHWQFCPAAGPAGAHGVSPPTSSPVAPPPPPPGANPEGGG